MSKPIAPHIAHQAAWMHTAVININNPFFGARRPLPPQNGDHVPKLTKARSHHTLN
jgi:hypothetical protein